MLSTLVAFATLGINTLPDDEFLSWVRLKEVNEWYPRTAKWLVNGTLGNDVQDCHLTEFKFVLFDPGVSEHVVNGQVVDSQENSIQVELKEPCGVLSPFNGTNGVGWHRAGTGAGTSALVLGLEGGGSSSGEGSLLVQLPLNGGSSQQYFLCRLTTWTYVGVHPNGSWQANYTEKRPIVTLTKVSCTTDAAIDSRKGFGRANQDGTVDPLSNWTSQNLNFGGYTFNGGLFVGNMVHVPGSQHPIYRDRSGTARVQFKPGQLPTGDPLVATMTVFDMGWPENLSNLGGLVKASAPPIGVYVPRDNDPNIGWSELETTWDRRWLLTETDDPDPSKRAVACPGVTGESYFNTDATNNYVNYIVTSVNVSSAGATPPYSTTPFQHGLLLAISDEDEHLDETAWRYFASKEYEVEAVNKGFPYDDSRPRVWFTQYTGTHTWSPQ